MSATPVTQCALGLGCKLACHAEAHGKPELCGREAAATLPEIDRCPCGYPMPCVKTVPVQFCRGGEREAAAIEQDRSVARAKDSGVYDRVRDNAAHRLDLQYGGGAS